MSWAVLLTSCVRPIGASDEAAQKRLEIYSTAINLWLEKTNLPIFIVESSNYTFPEFANTRLNVCSFKLPIKSSSSQLEARSILYAMDFFGTELMKYSHIFKVTARYYVEVEDILQKLPVDVDIFPQHSHNPSINWNNSEFFGFKKGNEIIFLKRIENIGFMEQTIFNFSKESNSYRLPPLENITLARRGGDNLLVNPM
jgi:hypothetical protein